MTPRALALAALLLSGAVGGCDRATTPAPMPTANQVDPATFDNQSAATSIIRPAVVDEVAPSPTPTPPPEPLETTVGFDRGAVLDEDARAALDALVARAGFAGGGAIRIAGHSDTPGSDAANLITSRRRAEAVRDYLAGQGVPAERMTVVALGESNPVAPNALADGSDNPEGRRRNRRVDVTVAPPAPGPVPGPTPSETPEEGARARGG